MSHKVTDIFLMPSASSLDMPIFHLTKMDMVEGTAGTVSVASQEVPAAGPRHKSLCAVIAVPSDVL